jgi:hypothetical protein
VTEDPLRQSVPPDFVSGPHDLVLRGQYALEATSSLVGRGLARVTRGEWCEEKVTGVLATEYGGLIVSPVGDRLVCSSCYPDRHELSLYERRIGSWFLARRLKFSSPAQSSAFESLADYGAKVPCHAWSPCGRYLATGSGSDSECHEGWQADEQYEEARLLVFGTASGDCREVAVLHRDVLAMVAWSSGGEFLASVSHWYKDPVLRLCGTCQHG